MTFVALWSPGWPTGGAADDGPGDGVGTDTRRPGHCRGRSGDGVGSLRVGSLPDRLLALVPHVAVDAAGVTWANATGLPARRTALAALRMARHAWGGAPARAGVADVAVAAELAARRCPDDDATGGGGSAALERAPITVIAPEHERAFLAALPLGALAGTGAWAAVTRERPAARGVVAALAGVGVERCGELAALTRESVEVRFGPGGLALWRLARADDPRRIFRALPPALPAASLEWEEYVLRDTERLLFVANGLVGRVCTDLGASGRTARAMTLRFLLAGGGTAEHPVRAARGTADRVAWLRLVRAALERADLPDAVRGLALVVDAAHEAEAPQMDLFDVGGQTAAAGESAVARLVEDGHGLPVRLGVSAHALPEQRARWQPVTIDELAGALRVLPTAHPTAAAAAAAAGEGMVPEPLALRLLAEPQRVAVTTCLRRGDRVPVRYRERRRHGRGRAAPVAEPVPVITAVGPDRVAVGHEAGAPVQREYWQCLTGEGRLVLLYREAEEGAWYCHGWWD